MSPIIDERFCSECRQLYQNGPLPNPVECLATRDVGARIFPAGSWKHGLQVVQFGRWRASRDELYLSQYFAPTELNDLIEVARQVSDYFAKTDPRPPGRTAAKVEFVAPSRAEKALATLPAKRKRRR